MKITGNEPINPTIWNNCYKPNNDGLTIRQHFAAMAMQGILSSFNSQTNTNSNIVVMAVKYADILIEELNKSENKD